MAGDEGKILDESTERTKGLDAQTSNIEAAKAVSEIVKSTLGPTGMDKLLIDSMGESIVTNDGVKILKEMQIEHPGAKLITEVAKTQDSEVGDGTTSAVILSGELLSQAQNLLSQKLHPTTINRGYKKATQKALDILEEDSTEVNLEDKEILTKVCETAMTGKVAESAKEKLSSIVLETVSLVKEEDSIPKDKIKIQKAPGGKIEESSIVKGVVLDKQLANPNMPKKKTGPKILLVDFPLEVRELDSEAKVNLNSLQEYEEFIKGEQEYLKSLAFKIKEIGANVVVCQKGIDDGVAYYLAKEGIMAIRRSKRSDLEKLSYALGKHIVSSVEDLKEESLGYAENVEVKQVLGEDYVFVEGCENPKSITLFLKASTTHLLDEVERAVEDSLGDINSILKSRKVVAGGGATELSLYKKLSEYAKKFSGKEQLVIKSYAESFLSLPKVLCQNSGFDEIETIASLTSQHEQENKRAGLDGFEGIKEDTLKAGIVEPVDLKIQIINSAVESSSMVLRIDDVIAAKTLNKDN